MTSADTVVAPTKLSPEQRKVWATGLAEKFSRDFARIMDRRKKASSLDQDIVRLFSFLLWKLDWTVDNDPNYVPGAGRDLAKDGDSEEELAKDTKKMLGFKRKDASKFGPALHVADSAAANYEELVSKVEARFGPNPQEALAAVDTAVFLYLRCTDMLATPNGVAAAMKTVSLEKYLFCRGWSGGLPLCAGVGWCGDEWPKDGTVEQAGIAGAIVNDLYDYHRDKEENTHLNVWHYFDSVEDAIPYVEKYWYDVRGRVNADLKEWMDRFLKYQQDEKMQSQRGFDRDWYALLNKTFHC